MKSKGLDTVVEGDVISLQLPGAGGYGDPRNRDLDAIDRDLRDLSIDDVMSRKPITIDAEALAVEAVRLMEETAAAKGIPLQRSAQVGVLTDLSYVQLVGAGVAAVDVGFPMRYSHSAVEMVDLSDLDGLAKLLVAALDSLAPDVPLERP